MRTDADDLARVRYPAIQLLFSHAVTLTDKWCSHPRPVDNGLRASARSGLPTDPKSIGRACFPVADQAGTAVPWSSSAMFE